MAGFRGSGGFKGGNRGGFRGGQGRPSFNRDRGGRGGDRPQMFKATCDSCHKECEVPFRPTGDKPVYCNDCFRSGRGERGDRGDRGGQAPSSAPRPQTIINDSRIDELKKQIEAINTKLDTLIATIEASSKAAPKAPKKEKKEVSLKKLIAKAQGKSEKPKKLAKKK